MKKKIQFSLVYRDMWQSSGKFQPRKDQLERIAPVIIEMGCFARVETNGGAFEQVNLLAGENPNDAVRAFCKPFNEAGIKTHMLDRGLNALRMYPVPDDVRALMYKVKAKQGTNITRIFDGLNDVRNIIPSIKWAKEGGMTPQCALCITNSPVHTLEYYMNIADQVIAAGAEEICLKDMAGIGQPAFLGKLTKMIKDKYPEIIIQYHGHSGPGLSMASILEVCNNGADIIDTAIEPLSWGKVHPDVISVISMLKNEGFEVPEINMSAYMKARALTQEFIDDWLGYFINPGNKIMSSLLLGCGLPGGMMGSMMADLGGMRTTINNVRKKKGEDELSMDDLLIKLFDEVEYVWPRVGYPPLVTPFSQYVKNIALMNLLTIEQGKGRFVMMDESMWGMILGKSGKIPGTIDPELVELAKKQAASLLMSTLTHCSPTLSTTSARRWTRTVGNMARTTRNSSSLPCTRSSIATSRAARPKRTSLPTCRSSRTQSSAPTFLPSSSAPTSTPRPTLSLLLSRAKSTGNSQARANALLLLSRSSARSTRRATSFATSRLLGASLLRCQQPSAASSLRLTPSVALRFRRVTLLPTSSVSTSKPLNTYKKCTNRLLTNTTEDATSCATSS